MTPPAPEKPAPRARPRRRRRLLAGVALLALLGLGARWIGSGDGAAEPAADTPPAAAAEGPPVADRGDATLVAAAESAPPVPDPAPAKPDAPTGPPGEAAEAAAEGPAAAPAGVDPDRFQSLLSVAERAVRTRQVAEARDALAALRAMPLGADQVARLAMLETELAGAQSARAREILALVQRGSVLAARADLATALADGTDSSAALRAALVEGGLGAELEAPPSEDRARWPLPAALRRNREVRASLPDGVVVGRVVDSRPEHVTLRVEGPRGLKFPTVRVVACEPVDALPAEAAEMGFAALQAGDPVLARLWLACAEAGAGDPDPRVERLSTLLR